ncbi:MAG: SpoIIE family protein phosphatase [Spirochaetes bacterium]|nr:SpoIIE family protein phosphatase [Spirochaetota bacterium]MBU1082107.1 SpoIIE family protein phosphatase [Spirochaetota bacterium]
MKRLVIAFLLGMSAGSAFAQYVDLGECTFYIRAGFEDSWTRRLPAAGDGSWTVVAPTRGERSLEMRALGLPGTPRGGTFSFFPAPPMEFTVLVPFGADLTLLNSSDPALFLKHVGQEWAVYLNGVLLRSEFVRSGTGYLERSLRDVIVPLDKRRLARGQNLLAFRLRGDPVDDRTGFNRSGPYGIGSYRSLASGNREYVDLMLIGVYAFFALYHCVLFALRPKNKAYLYFGVSTLLLAAYMAARTNAATAIVADTAVLRRIEYSSLFLALPAILAFLESLLLMRRSAFVVAVAAFSAASAVAGQFLRLEPLLYIWYAAALASVAYALVSTFGKAMARDYREMRAAADPSADSPTALALFASVLVRKDSGRVAMGSLVFGLAVLADVWLVGAAGGTVFWSKYAFFVFITLTASVLARQFAEVSERAEAMNAGLETEVDARTAELSAATAERVRLNEEISSANALLSSAMEESERDVRIAAAVQKGFFPARPLATAGWDVSYVFEPASGLSSDFYDFFQDGKSLSGVLLGSVSGSGVASGLVTVLAKNVFGRGMSEMAGEPLAAMLSRVNRELSRELSVVGNTVSCTFLRFSGDRVEYVNAGHTDAFLRKGGSKRVAGLDEGRKRSPPFGRDDFDDGLLALRFTLSPGDALLVYTAGLVESVNAKKAAYGGARLAEAWRRADPHNAESLLASVMIDFRNFMAGSRRAGDICAMAVVKR